MVEPTEHWTEAVREMRGRGALPGASRIGAAPEAMADPAPASALTLEDAHLSTATAALVERARTGDEIAFTALVERRLDRAYRTARATLGNEADARDATQEAFLHAWRDLPRLRDPERFDAWLGRILVNSCREAMRGRRRRFVREIATSDVNDPIATAPARAEAPDERAASIDLLERAFERLSVDERAILVLHHLEQQPLAEIAASLAIPTGTAKSRLSAARHALERALEAERR